MNELDFKERNASFEKAVLDILRYTYGEDRGVSDRLAAGRIALLYANRENELMNSILDRVKYMPSYRKD